MEMNLTTARELRKKIKKDDIVEFTNRDTNEKMLVIVEDLFMYPSFEELYKHFDKVSLGYKENEDANYKDMEEYYSKENQKKYGKEGLTT